MSSPTRDIEKERLEAHVELCAARYSRLEEKLDNLEGRVIGIETVLGEIRDTIVKDREKRQTQSLKLKSVICANKRQEELLLL